ncbi:MAG: hypothetical protein ACJ0H0_01680 [Vicinamibacterales bacterium]
MNQANYDQQNQVKASFNSIYSEPTPHHYLRRMLALDYKMADQMKSYLSATVDMVTDFQSTAMVLDVGCSYGISAALLKTGCSYRDLTEFYLQEASSEYDGCVVSTQRWLETHATRQNVKVVGLDSSAPAIKFAVSSHMIDEGIARNLEEENSKLTDDEARLIRECNVLMSTGAIGYVTEKTLDVVLDEFDKNSTFKPRGGGVVLMSVLELFDLVPIEKVFTNHGYLFRKLPIRIPQRRFVDEEERNGILETLKQRNTLTDAQRSEHQMFANLCIAAKPERLKSFTKCISDANHAYSLPA